MRLPAVALARAFQLDDAEPVGELNTELFVGHVGAHSGFRILWSTTSLLPKFGRFAAALMPLLWGGCGLEQKLLGCMVPLAPICRRRSGTVSKLLAGRFDKQGGQAVWLNGSWRALFPPKGVLHVAWDEDRHGRVVTSR